MRAALALAAGLLVVLAAEGAWATGTPADLEALRARTALALNDHAEWCIKKRLFGQRDDTYEILLTFDPDHKGARKKLRFKKSDSGAWERDARYKRARNLARSGLEQEQERRAAVLATYRTAQLEIYAAATRMRDVLWARRELTALMREDPAETRIAPILRTLCLDYYRRAEERALVAEMSETAGQLRGLYPGDLEVRTALAETLHDGRWVLVETARTLEGAARLDQVTRDALKAIGTPAPATPRDTEAKIKLPWRAGVETEDVRAMGTVEGKVLAQVASLCQAAGPLFEAALETKPERREGLTLYLFGGKGEIDTFLSQYPVVANPSLEQRLTLDLDLVYADGRSLALKKNPPFGQLDLAVNTVLNQVFSDSLLGGADLRGWHAEGISRYLAFKLTGTRHSINVAGTYAGQGGDRHVPESKESWLARAHGFTSRKASVGLALMLGKGIDTFAVRDAVISYAFAVYLLEGTDKLAAPFVRTLHESADVDKACREILGAPLSIVEYRFKMWLNEVTTPAKPTNEEPK